MSVKVLTANRLADGGVVYLNTAGGWSANLQEAATADGPEAEADLEARAARAVAECLIVDPYLFPVTANAGGLAPASQRECIRAAGPSVPVPASAAAEAKEPRHVSL